MFGVSKIRHFQKACFLQLHSKHGMCTESGCGDWHSVLWDFCFTSTCVGSLLSCGVKAGCRPRGVGERGVKGPVVQVEGDSEKSLCSFRV